MGKYSVPEEIRKLKPKGTMVKNINGKFYVYEYTMTGGRKNKKTKMGKMIGRIDPQRGMIYNSSHVSDDSPSIFDFGQYFFAFETSRRVYKELTVFFNPDDAARIYLMGLIHAVRCYTPLYSLPTVFRQSWLSIYFKGIPFGEQTLSDLLDDLGRKPERTRKYEQYLADVCEEMALDGHCFESYSALNGLTEYGNKYKKTGNMQLNLIGGYDTKTGMMVFSRFVKGSLLDKVSVNLVLEILDFKNTRFLIDNGFFSDTVLSQMEKDGNSFIIPLNTGSTLYKAAVKDLVYDREFFYVAGDSKSRLIWAHEFKGSVIPGGRRVIVYKDLERNLKESSDYLSNLQKGLPGFSQEKYDELRDFFGVIVLYTSEGVTSLEEIFFAYKRRWRIETFYNMLKNSMDFNDFRFDDYYMVEGLGVIILVASRIYSLMGESLGKLKGTSMYKLLTTLNGLKAELKKDGYAIRNRTKEIRELFEKLGISLPKDDTEISPLYEKTDVPT